MSESDVKFLQRIGIIVIIALWLNFWMIHRREDAVREFGMYYQGVITGTQLQQAPSNITPYSSPLFQSHEN